MQERRQRMAGLLKEEFFTKNERISQHARQTPKHFKNRMATLEPCAAARR
jgi:hypothetical protein